MTVAIYHNPACGTSRNALALIRATGVEPQVIEYLQTPPGRAELERLIARMGIAPRALLRRKGTPYDELGLDDETLDDHALVEAMLAHPLLINRPIVAGRGAAVPSFGTGPRPARPAAARFHQGRRRDRQGPPGLSAARRHSIARHHHFITGTHTDGLDRR